MKNLLAYAAALAAAVGLGFAVSVPAQAQGGGDEAEQMCKAQNLTTGTSNYEILGFSSVGECVSMYTTSGPAHDCKVLAWIDPEGFAANYTSLGDCVSARANS
jgi:uncharacterized membrane protein